MFPKTYVLKDDRFDMRIGRRFVEHLHVEWEVIVTSDVTKGWRQTWLQL